MYAYYITKKSIQFFMNGVEEDGKEKIEWVS